MASWYDNARSFKSYEGKKKEKALAKKYFKFLGKRTKVKGKNKKDTFNKRKKMIFKS